MTPARKTALQWLLKMGAVNPNDMTISSSMMILMEHECQMEFDCALNAYTLTDKGRRALNGDSE